MVIQKTHPFIFIDITFHWNILWFEKMLRCLCSNHLNIELKKSNQ